MELTMKEEQKVNILQAVMSGQITVSESSRLLSRSERSIYRMLSRIKKEGVRGVIHKNKNRPATNKTSVDLEQQILQLARGELQDINDCHLKELLLEREGIKIGRETLRRLLRSNGVAPKHKRRGSKYYQRRDRKEAMGMMLQVDASIHDWLEGRGPKKFTMVGAIDDATGHVWAQFVPAETTWSYLELVRNVIETHGIPLSLYADRHSIFHVHRDPTIIEQLEGKRALTQFGRAMEELGANVLKAWTAQAKGRIERLWQTFQDRLIVEMRLAGISDMAQANDFLKTYLEKHNNRFVVKPKKHEKLFIKAPKSSVLDMILCIKETRTVSNDHTISFQGTTLQIPPSRKYASIAKQKVQVLQMRDKSLAIIYKNNIIVRFDKKAVAALIKKNNSNHDLEAA